MKRIMIIALAIGAVGCGQAFKSGNTAQKGSPAVTGGNVNVADQIARAELATAEAQKAMTEANAAIAQLTDANGNINIKLFMGGSSQVDTQGILAPLIAKFQPIFDKVYNKALAVKQQFETAKLALQDALSKLSSSDPAQAAQITALTNQIAQVTAMEGAFRIQIRSLASKLTLAITGLDNLISGATSFIPGFGWLANLAINFLVMDDVKNMILDLQMKLMSL